MEKNILNKSLFKSWIMNTYGILLVQTLNEVPKKTRGKNNTNKKQYILTITGMPFTMTGIKN